jgi:hypothetical protein
MKNFGIHSSYDDPPIPTCNDSSAEPNSPYFPGASNGIVDGGDGSGVPRRHNTEGLKDLDRGLRDSMSVPEGMNSGTAGDKKKFTEDLHSRKSNGRSEPSSLKGHHEEK